ncbi:hypothetical protein AB0L40_08940 [Patulibacter sp. NPDC049589]|uniref:hypothetical protein n=1 Tax=Patulibacter sp. NPDC049589 TaxID=3154731 RepID=UPI0034343619
MTETEAVAPALSALAAALRDEGGLLAAVVRDPAPDADRTIATAVEAGPRSSVVGPALALAAEATREAELLHHAPELARVVATDDRDLALLAGDRLYALGLERLAEGGWTDDVATLADIVALVARLHAVPAWAIGPARVGSPATGTGAPEEAAARTADLWAAAAAALGRGAGSPAAALLRDVRDGQVPDSSALRAAATAPDDGSYTP